MSLKKVDIAINVYGKPYQTIVAINSLLKYSGAHVHKIFLIVEKNQPNPNDVEIIRQHIQFENIEYFTPQLFLGWWPGRRTGLFNKLLMPFQKYRYAIRYQYAFEKSDQDYLFLMHNDMIFYGDILGAYLDGIGNYIGIGQVGQCHNCPAFEKHCTPDTYLNYRPSMAELTALYAKQPHLRAEENGFYKKINQHWPLPECRLNEFASLINLKIARPVTYPMGNCLPPGYFGYIDIGTDWFLNVHQKGFQVKHMAFDAFGKHSWALESSSSGHSSLFDKDKYALEESIAESYVKDNKY